MNLRKQLKNTDGWLPIMDHYSFLWAKYQLMRVWSSAVYFIVLVLFFMGVAAI